MKPLLNILILDDDNMFAKSLAQNIQRKLETRLAFDTSVLHVGLATQIDEIESKFNECAWDIVLCDLGWGDLNLEGVQILNHMKMEKPGIATVLYTSQDPDDEAISQTIQWKLNFVDYIVLVESERYLDQMLRAIQDVFEAKRNDLIKSLDQKQILKRLDLFVERAENQLSGELSPILEESVGLDYNLRRLFPECSFVSSYYSQLSKGQLEEAIDRIRHVIDTIDQLPQTDPIKVLGLRLLDKDTRDEFVEKVKDQLNVIQEIMSPLLKINDDLELAADIHLSSHNLSLKIKNHPLDKQQKKYNELVRNLTNFPRVENHELLALDKEKFIEYVKNTYGGFPKMADERGLDLNNIYRVNRKFKNLPFIVFKLETINEILGIYDANELEGTLGVLLAGERSLRVLIRAS